jgi:CheY-like chemotaxis protein
VLLVEDNALNQEVALELLRQAGLDVDLAENGVAAVEMVRRNDYDLVFMDVQMPVMDGLAATRRIRALPARNRVPIVAMTANAMSSDRARCMEAGMNDHIAKPINPDELHSKLLAWLTVEKRAAPPALESGALSDLDGIAGLDIRHGVGQLEGREQLYRKVLATFVRTQVEAAVRIRRALDENDRKAAIRAAHTLKGVTAQIGARSLRDQAERLESALRGDAPLKVIEEALGRLEPELGTLLGELRARLGPEPPA